MVRILAFLAIFLAVSPMASTPARADEALVETDMPADLEVCLLNVLNGLFGISRGDQEKLFEFFLANIDFEKFGRYNFKLAWREWGQNSELKRLAVYEYFSLMASRRGEHPGDTTSFAARLAERPLVTGDNVYHIIAQANFADGSSTSVVVFTYGCDAFGFMYGGANLRSFVNASTIERSFKSGKRAPF